MYEYVKNMKEEKFLKITICDENSSIFNSIIKKLRQIGEIKVLDVSHMSRKVIRQGTEDITIEYFYTEISSENVNKWNAIEFLIKKEQIKKEEVIAIGDNINDKEMIENAGLGIAMEGSTPIICDSAKYITKTNDKDGVAVALEKFCLDR